VQRRDRPSGNSVEPKEQDSVISELRDVAAKMSNDDGYDFKMLSKRSADGEELDQLAQRRLGELHRKYVVKGGQKDIDQLLKKYSAQVKDFGHGKS